MLRPDADGTCRDIYWYTTAVLAAKFGIILHAVQVLSTHIHEVVSDPYGNLPAFLRERNRALANALKCHRGWPEEVFQRAAASCVELYGAKAIADKIAYTIANCVEAGLVEKPEDWPGAKSTVADIGGPAVRVSRPKMYFDPTNQVWPDHAEVALQLPNALHEQHGANALAALNDAVETVVRQARLVARRAGKLVGSVRRLFALPIFRRSRTHETFGAREPHFAAGGDPEQAMRAKAERRVFLTAYRAALEAWRNGSSHPTFPAGTWRWLRELLNPSAKTSMSVGSSRLSSRNGEQSQRSALTLELGAFEQFP